MEQELFKYKVGKGRECGMLNKSFIDADELDKKVKEAVANPKTKKIKVTYLKDGKLRSFEGDVI